MYRLSSGTVTTVSCSSLIGYAKLINQRQPTRCIGNDYTGYPRELNGYNKYVLLLTGSLKELLMSPMMTQLTYLNKQQQKKIPNALLKWIQAFD